jgi:tRNA(Ile)-lysidine synthase
VGPHPAVAAARGAVRRGLAGLQPGDLVLAACSGGADSLALAAALAFEAPRAGLRAGGVTVDHGLQPGSAERATQVVAILARLGLDPVDQVPVTVSRGPASGGPEAAARTARYAALDQAARERGAAAVLLGHTRDDQAETVLLGLARGAGGHAVAGMPARRGCLRRPLLGVSRATLREACLAQGLAPWDDPHNRDPAYARARVRHQALPALEAALGPGIAEALARTAAQVSADCEALDAIARAEAWRVQVPGRMVPGEPGRTVPGEPGRTVPGEPVRDADEDSRAALDPGEAGTGLRAVVYLEGLDGLAPAIRTRVLHAAALAAGCPGGALSAAHIAALDALVTDWHGQRGADLPGGVAARRRYGKLLFVGDRSAGAAPSVRTEAEVAGGRE